MWRCVGSMLVHATNLSQKFHKVTEWQLKVNKEGHVHLLSHLPLFPRACPISLYHHLACRCWWIWANPRQLAHEDHGVTHVGHPILTLLIFDGVCCLHSICFPHCSKLQHVHFCATKDCCLLVSRTLPVPERAPAGACRFRPKFLTCGIR